MIHIALIGAGNIGNRHLQAIKKINKDLQIYVIDPSPKSLQIAKKRYEEIKTPHGKEHSVYYLKDTKNIDNNLDIVIVATTSDIRKSVIFELLNTIEVNNIILEKILFQKKEDYEEISQIFKDREINAWVNTPIRIMNFFSNLKPMLKDKKKTYIVYGSNWGLMCNSIHFIDYMSYLSNCLDFQVETSNLIPKLYPSKRENFSELNGIININFKNGDHCFLQCYEGKNHIRNQELITSNQRIIFFEKYQKAFIYNNSFSNEISLKEENAKYEYQSSMTKKLVNNIIESGNCNLPSYEYSKIIHLNFFEPILEYIKNNINPNIDHYPFT